MISICGLENSWHFPEYGSSDLIVKQALEGVLPRICTQMHRIYELHMVKYVLMGCRWGPRCIWPRFDMRRSWHQVQSPGWPVNLTPESLSTQMRARKNGCLFADDIFKCIFLNENIRISNNISLKFVPKDLSNNIPALVFIMAWRRPGDKPLSEPMMVSSLTHICVSRLQWINKRG